MTFVKPLLEIMGPEAGIVSYKMSSVFLQATSLEFRLFFISLEQEANFAQQASSPRTLTTLVNSKHGLALVSRE